jgi:hypothetical protein
MIQIVFGNGITKPIFRILPTVCVLVRVRMLMTFEHICYNLSGFLPLLKENRVICIGLFLIGVLVDVLVLAPRCFTASLL